MQDVPRDATSTRTALIRAGERLFAVRGIDAALTADITRAAGQANASAVQYHFGSREGLLAAICDKHVALMEPARRAALDRIRDEAAGPDLRDVVTALVMPTAAALSTPGGRDFLRITAQLAGRAGVRDRRRPAVIAGTALAEQLSMLEDICSQTLPRDVARERIAVVIGMLTAALAERAELRERRRAPVAGEGAFGGQAQVNATHPSSSPELTISTMPACLGVKSRRCSQTARTSNQANSPAT
jgi:AcrR family transcriptional regulator